MRALITSFLSLYPLQTITILGAMILASVAEALGVITMFPLFSLFSNEQQDNNYILEAFTKGFAFFNFPMTLNAILLVILILTLIYVVLTFSASKLIGYTMSNIGHDLRIRVMNALMNACWPFFKSLSIGQMTNAVSSQIQQTATTYAILCKVSSELILMSTFIITAAVISWKFSLIALVAVIVVTLALTKYFKLLKKAGQAQTFALSNLATMFTDNLAAIKVIKSTGQEDIFSRNLVKQSENIRNAKKNQVLSEQTSRALRQITIIAFLTGGVYVSYNFLAMPMMEIGVFALIFIRIMGRITGLQKQYQDLMVHESAYWAVMEVCQAAEKNKEVWFGTEVPHLDNNITLKNVDFVHENSTDDTFTLTDLSLTIPAHKFNCILGPSGSGKTTLVDLILGFYIPNEGIIYLDDIPLNDIDLKEWRRSVGYVSQECPMLHDSIYNNIVMGQTNFSKEDVLNALDQAGATEFVKHLPNGIHEIVGERGLRFSGGQRQRIVIARALINKPQLLILDEATSALDKKTEEQIFNQMKNISNNITIIAISHDVNIQDYADNIFKLKSGKIIT